MQYRWDCGSGTGIVRVNSARVADGKWHSLKVSRRSRHVRVTVDDTHIAEGDSPAGSDVVNLYKNAMRLMPSFRPIHHSFYQRFISFCVIFPGFLYFVAENVVGKSRFNGCYLGLNNHLVLLLKCH